MSGIVAIVIATVVLLQSEGQPVASSLLASPGQPVGGRLCRLGRPLRGRGAAPAPAHGRPSAAPARTVRRTSAPAATTTTATAATAAGRPAECARLRSQLARIPLPQDKEGMYSGCAVPVCHPVVSPVWVSAAWGAANTPVSLLFPDCWRYRPKMSQLQSPGGLYLQTGHRSSIDQPELTP